MSSICYYVELLVYNVASLARIIVLSCFVTKSFPCVRKWKYCKTQLPRSSTSHADVRVPVAMLHHRLSSPHTQEDEIPIDDYPLLTTHSQQHSIQSCKISSWAHMEKTSLLDIAKVIHHTTSQIVTTPYTG